MSAAVVGNANQTAYFFIVPKTSDKFSALVWLVRKENKLSHMSTKIKQVLHPNTFGFVALILISQIGSRLIVDEIHSECGEALDNPLVKLAVLYSILYLATKDIISSIVWTGVVAASWSWFIRGPGKIYCQRPRDGHHSFAH